MSKNFWQQLKKPYFVLAPMADVTDMAFRQIVAECGKPDIFYTEFVSADGLCSPKGRPKLLPHLKFKENERPIVAQFFGSTPENFYECAKLAVELGFDGVDVNMGCPSGKIMKQDSGASLILNPELAQSIVRETKRGVRDAGSEIPVSVKTRIGYNTIVTEEWISKLIEAKPDGIIVHGRTAKEMSKVPAHWDEIGKAAKLCRAAGIPIIGNGDVMTYDEGTQKAQELGLEGIMVGRGIFHNPWFFAPLVRAEVRGIEERTRLARRHIELFAELWGTEKNFDVMKRFFKVYISGFDGAKELRDELMKTKKPSEALPILAPPTTP